MRSGHLQACATGCLKLEHQRVWALRSGPISPLLSKQNKTTKVTTTSPTITKSNLKRKTFISSYTSRKWSIDREVTAGTWREEEKQSHKGVPFADLLSMACSATSLGWHDSGVNWALSDQSSIKQMHRRLVHRQFSGNIFSVEIPFFQMTLGLCQVAMERASTSWMPKGRCTIRKAGPLRQSRVVWLVLRGLVLIGLERAI